MTIASEESKITIDPTIAKLNYFECMDVFDSYCMCLDKEVYKVALPWMSSDVLSRLYRDATGRDAVGGRLAVMNALRDVIYAENMPGLEEDAIAYAEKLISRSDGPEEITNAWARGVYWLKKKGLIKEVTPLLDFIWIGEHGPETGGVYRSIRTGLDYQFRSAGVTATESALSGRTSCKPLLDNDDEYDIYGHDQYRASFLGGDDALMCYEYTNQGFLPSLGSCMRLSPGAFLRMDLLTSLACLVSLRVACRESEDWRPKGIKAKLKAAYGTVLYRLNC